jgi:hypothetical protein
MDIGAVQTVEDALTLVNSIAKEKGITPRVALGLLVSMQPWFQIHVVLALHGQGLVDLQTIMQRIETELKILMRTAEIAKNQVTVLETIMKALSTEPEANTTVQ